MLFDNPRTLIIVSIVAVICLFFVVLYMRFQKVKEQRRQRAEDALIDEGAASLTRDYFRDDGTTLNPDPFMFVESDETVVKDDKTSTQKKNKEKGLVSRVLDTLKSGKLLKGINSFSVTTSKKLAERLDARDQTTPEEKAEREKIARLADDAVNPLLSMRIAKIKKEQQEQEARKADADSKHAAATKLLSGASSGKSGEGDEKDGRGEGDAEEGESKGKAGRGGGIYQLSAEQIAELQKVMSASSSNENQQSLKNDSAKNATKRKDDNDVNDKNIKTIANDDGGGKERGYLGEEGVDGAVQGAFQTEATRRYRENKTEQEERGENVEEA